MTTTEPRKLSKTSMFTMETLMTAPADLEVVRRSRKYQDLRKKLLEAFEQKAWGIRLIVSAETPEELKKQICCLRNAGWKWADSGKLKVLKGATLSIHMKIYEDKVTGMLEMYFVRDDEDLA